MHQTHHEPIRRQENKPEREYQELLPGTPVWVQHRQDATWEPAVVNQTDAPNSYWIIQENGAQQPKIYRHTRTFLKTRYTPIDGEVKAQMKKWMPEKENAEFLAPAVHYVSRNPMVENSQDRSPSSCLTPLLHTLDLPNSQNFSERREEDSQLAEPLCTSGTTLENAPSAPDAPVQRKSTKNNFGKEPQDLETSFMCKDSKSAQ